MFSCARITSNVVFSLTLSRSHTYDETIDSLFRSHKKEISWSKSLKQNSVEYIYAVKCRRFFSTQCEPINSITFTAMAIERWLGSNNRMSDGHNEQAKKGKSSFKKHFFEDFFLLYTQHAAVRKVDLCVVKWKKKFLSKRDTQLSGICWESISITISRVHSQIFAAEWSALSLSLIESNFCAVMREHFGVNDNMLKLYQLGCCVLSFAAASSKKSQKFNCRLPCGYVWKNFWFLSLSCCLSKSFHRERNVCRNSNRIPSPSNTACVKIEIFP